MFKVKLKKSVGPIYEVYAVQNDLDGRIRFLIYQPPSLTSTVTEGWVWKIASDFEPAHEESYSPPSSLPWWWNYPWWEVNPTWEPRYNTITTDRTTPIYDIHVGDMSSVMSDTTANPSIQNPNITTATSSN